MSQLRLNAIVTGRVQGVGFRFFVERVADALALTGFVRNLPSGAVEVVAEGGKDQLAALVEALNKGPSAADVDNVEIRWSNPTGEFSGFNIRR